MAKQKPQIDDTAQGVGADTFQEATTETAQAIAPEPTAEPSSEAPTETTSEEKGEEGDGNDTVATAQSVPKDNTPEPKQEKASTSQKGSQKSLGEEADSYTDNLLQSYPNYESLYIDRQGGVFTADTPKAIRGSAKLYKNPHYKS